ncbi:MAG: NAD(+)/NADH kinase [Candidatus Diapherotrites archaeon]
MKKIKCIGLTANTKNYSAVKAARKAKKLLELLGVKVIGIKGIRAGEEKELKHFDCDLCIVFGGDGTMLHAAREVSGKIPLIGVNCGTEGHLMQLNEKNFLQEIPSLAKGKFSVEKRMRLQAFNGKKRTPLSLNEVTLAARESVTLIRYELKVNGRKVWEDASDGVIIATPTGSSAHAYSAGGKKLRAGSEAIEIVPINSTKREKRKARVFGANAKIELLPKQEDAWIIIDGQVREKANGKISVRKGNGARVALLN